MPIITAEDLKYREVFNELNTKSKSELILLILDNEHIKTNNIKLQQIKIELEKYIKDCEINEEMFKNKNMETAKLCSNSMKLAYNNVIDLFNKFNIL